MSGKGHRHDWYVYNTINQSCGCVILQKACRSACGASTSETQLCDTHSR